MRRTFVILFVVVLSACFAHENTDFINDDAMEQIIANEANCVQRYEQDRIYLVPDKIFPTEHGLYLDVNGVNFIRLPNVSSDNNGCYIAKRKILNDCPYCGQPYFIRCKNPNCPGKKKQ
jgi:hypothetical protein